MALLGSVQLDVTQVNLTRVHVSPNGTEAMPLRGRRPVSRVA